MKKATYLKLIQKQPVTEQEVVEWMYDYVQTRRGDKATKPFTDLLTFYQGIKNFLGLFPEALQNSIEYYGKVNNVTLTYGKSQEVLHVRL